MRVLDLRDHELISLFSVSFELTARLLRSSSLQHATVWSAGARVAVFHHHRPRCVRLKDLLDSGRRVTLQPDHDLIILLRILLLLLLPYENRVVRSEKKDESKSERMGVRGISIRA
jgi:hypothetical protein